MEHFKFDVCICDGDAEEIIGDFSFDAESYTTERLVIIACDIVGSPAAKEVEIVADGVLFVTTDGRRVAVRAL